MVNVLCAWKQVAINDDEKRKTTGEKYVTLSKEKKCYSCDGYNTNCNEYIALKK